jgi:hypothetical protein
LICAPSAIPDIQCASSAYSAFWAAWQAFGMAA